MNHIKLTKKNIDNLSTTEGKKIDYWDTDLPLFLSEVAG